MIRPFNSLLNEKQAEIFNNSRDKIFSAAGVNDAVDAVSSAKSALTDKLGSFNSTFSFF